MKADFRRVVVNPNGRTPDIMAEILAVAKEYLLQPREFSQQFRRDSEAETCRALWEWVKGNIIYVLDPPAVQDVKTPARTVADKFGDCKSYAILIVCCLYCLGIRCRFRFVGFKPGGKFAHVYVVALPQSGGELVLDPCMHAFDTEFPYLFKTDR